MKNHITYIIAALSMLAFFSCSKEDPFVNSEQKTGRLFTRTMTLGLSNEESVVRASASPEVSDFMIDFIKEGKTEPELSFKYSEMPEIVTLPVGKYTAVATYGENAHSAWDAPYYKGISEEFEIIDNEITDNVAPIVAKLSNVKVTIILDDALKQAIDEDSYVNVSVGEKGSLDYTLDHVANGATGFFAHIEESHTLAATFHGNVQGYETHETKTYSNVAPGNHYRITFKLHSADITDPGYITTGVVVDAQVEIVDMNQNVDIEDDPIVDDMRPKEETSEPDPGPGPIVGNGPEITAEAPVNIDAVNDVTPGMACVLNVKSEAEGGIQQFMVYIDSETLTSDVLSDVGLSTTLDMVNPGGLEEALRGLPLPVKEQVKGQSMVRFDITGFMDLLGIYGAANHKFTLEVTDANGTTRKTLKLRTL